MTEKGLKYLADIIHAIELIEEFTISISSYSDYEKDLKTQSAVERQLGIIHAYDAVDSSMIWAIIKRHLNPLYEEVKEIID